MVPFIKRHWIVILLYAALTVIMTYPFVKTMATHLDDPVDPALVSWILNWNFDVFKSGDFLNYFNTSAFYPYKDTLLFSETFLTQSIIGFPIFLLTDNIILTYNILVLISFFFSALAAYFLTLYYTKDRSISFFAGLIYGFALFRFGHVGHLQIISTYFIPLTILFFEKTLKNPSKKNLAGFIISFVLLSHASLYQMVFTSIVLPVIFLYRWITNRKDFDKRLFLSLIMSGAFIVLGLIPTFYKYQAFSKDHFVKRSIEENIIYSAEIESLTIAPFSNHLYGGNCAVLEAKAKKNLYCYEKIFFPGISVAILGLIAVIGLLLNRKYKFFNKNKSLNIILIFGMLIFSFVLALGPKLKSLGVVKSIKLPYYFLYSVYPPAQGTRVPARWNIFFYLFLAILAALGLGFILKFIKNKTGKILIVAIVSLIVLFEYNSTPVQSKFLFDRKNSAYTYVRDNVDVKVVAQLPLWVSKYSNLLDDSEALLGQTYHKKKIVNGYSGFNPEGHDLLAEYITDRFPDRESLYILRAFEIDHVILTRTKYDPEIYRLKPFVESNDITLKFENEKFFVYKINEIDKKRVNGDFRIDAQLDEVFEGQDSLNITGQVINDGDAVWVTKDSTPTNETLVVKVNGEEMKRKESSFKKPLFVLKETPYKKKLTVNTPKLKKGDVITVTYNGKELVAKTVE